MNARVASPGSSAEDTASATVRRTSRLESCNRDSAYVERKLVLVADGHRSAEASSPNSRAHALWLEIAFSRGSSPRARTAGGAVPARLRR